MWQRACATRVQPLQRCIRASPGCPPLVRCTPWPRPRVMRPVNWGSVRAASTLRHPPPPPPADSAYSSISLAADSSFSSASAVAITPAVPPSRMLDASGHETETWTALSSSDIGPPGRIMLYASEVAGLVGLNPYRSLVESFEAVWARTEPELYRHRISQVESELGVRLLTKDEEAQMLLAATPPLRAMLDEALARVQELSNEELTTHKAAFKAAARSTSGMTAEQSALVGDYLVGQLSKAYGTVNEDRALAAYEKIAEVTVVDNNRLFYARQIGECTVTPEELASAFAAAAAAHAAAGESTFAAPCPSHLALNDPCPPRLHRSLWVGGRVDGFSSDTGHLIEMKNRTRKFMRPLPLYDRCQMEVYLQVTERPAGELVERLRKKVSAEQAAGSIADVREAQQRDREKTAEEARAEGARRVHEMNPEEEDVSFLLGDDASAAVDLPPPPIRAPTADMEDVEQPAEDEVDLDFLNDATPPSMELEPEEDLSFLDAPSSAPPPVLSDASSPAFEIVGTQLLDDLGRSSSSSAGSITHILIREHLREAPPADADDDCDSEGEHDVVGGVHVDRAFMQSGRTPEARSAEEVELDGDTVAAASPPPPPQLFIDQLKRTPLRRDDTVWQTRILPPLRRFASFLTRFLADPALQRSYLLRRTEEDKLALLAEIAPPEAAARHASQGSYAAAARARREREEAMESEARMIAAELQQARYSHERDDRNGGARGQRPAKAKGQAKEAVEEVEFKQEVVAVAAPSAKPKRKRSYSKKAQGGVTAVLQE